GVEIDYCPTCRGVWLDRGELDKVVDRTVDALGQAPTSRSARPGDRAGYEDRDRGRGDDRRDDRYGEHPYDRDDGEHGRRRKSRESWFENLFDFD
ncbi:MAG: zf-TFIIB domain-containing protein, partial [Chloroflexota bacterium]